MKNKKVLTAVMVFVLVFALAVGSVATYAWFHSETKADIVYQIPTSSHRIIQFETATSKDVRGTLYPAVLRAGAVGDNATNDPANIITPAGHVTFSAKFIMFAPAPVNPDGTPSTETPKPVPLRLNVSSAAQIARATSKRDLLATGELEALMDFKLRYSIEGREMIVPMRLNGSGVISMQDPLHPDTRIDLGAIGTTTYTVFIVGGILSVVETASYISAPTHTLVFSGGSLMLMPDVETTVDVDAFLTVPDELTAKDLWNAKVNIALSVESPDIEEKP